MITLWYSVSCNTVVAGGWPCGGDGCVLSVFEFVELQTGTHTHAQRERETVRASYN